MVVVRVAVINLWVLPAPGLRDHNDRVLWHSFNISFDLEAGGQARCNRKARVAPWRDLVELRTLQEAIRTRIALAGGGGLASFGAN